MGLDFNAGEGFALRELIFGSTDQIVFRTDRDGFVRDASPAIRQLGYPLVDMLIGPHIQDLADRRFGPAVEAAFAAALAGHSPTEWTEFRTSAADMRESWFALRFAALRDELGAIRGTLGMVRSLAETRYLEEQLFRAELTDPLTGLTNRHAWLQMIEHLIEWDSPSTLALVDIDYFKAINLHYGIATADRFLVSFAEFLRSVAPADVSISRVGASRFGLLFSGWSTDRAGAACRDIVEILDSLRCSDRQGRFVITASMGLASVAGDLDHTVKAAEAALRLSRAKGGNTVTGSLRRSAAERRNPRPLA